MKKKTSIFDDDEIEELEVKSKHKEEKEDKKEKSEEKSSKEEKESKKEEKDSKKEEKKDKKSEEKEDKKEDKKDDKEKADEKDEKKDDVELSKSVIGEEVVAGSTIDLDFVTMTVEEASIADEVKLSFTRSSGYTYDTGLSAVTDKKYVYIKGKLTSKDTSTLDVRLKGNITVNGYNYDDVQVSMYDAEGSWEYQADPLVEYTYIIYAEVPNTLAENPESCVFEFAFDNKFSTDRIYKSDVQLKDFDNVYTAIIK